MRLRLSLVCLIALLPTLVAAGPDGCRGPERVYALSADASISEGCYPPTLCPVLFSGDIGGTFRLTPLGRDDATGDRAWAVTEVYWLARLGSEDRRFVGGGTFTLGDDAGPNAGLQRLTLELVPGDDPVTTFDSGWVRTTADFPDIDVRISIFGEMYYDTVIDVRALSF